MTGHHDIDFFDRPTQEVVSNSQDSLPTTLPEEPWGKLVFTDKSYRRNEEIELVSNEFVIGRRPSANLELTDSTISGTHVTIRRDRMRASIEDVSTNGTYQNTNKISKGQQVQLQDGDVISFVKKDYEEWTANNEKLEEKLKVKNFFEFRFVSYMHENFPVVPAFEKEYALREELGRGTYGTVYKVISRETGEPHAVKLVLRGNIKEVSAQEQMQIFESQLKEMNILKSLCHPGIIKIFEAYQTDNAHLFVLEYLPGGDVLTRLNEKGAYLEADAKKLMKNIIEAVSFMHSKGIVHRDLKLENLLLVGDEKATQVKIIDFGIAKSASEGLKTFCGSMNYIAPEIFQSRGSSSRQNYGRVVDMWSVGVITYVILARELPFLQGPDSEESVEELLVKMKKRPKWALMSSTARNFISQLLTIDSETRLTAELALKHPWLATLNDENDVQVVTRDNKRRIDERVNSVVKKFKNM